MLSKLRHFSGVNIVDLCMAIFHSARMKDSIAVFEEKHIRRMYDEKTETWFFSVVDIIQVLTEQSDFQTARKYWNKLKTRLKSEGSESVTNCHRLKLTAQDGKKYLTDVASAETLLRLVQSVPSPKAEPIKLWLAKVGYERIQEMADPEIAFNRSRSLCNSMGVRKNGSSSACWGSAKLLAFS